MSQEKTLKMEACLKIVMSQTNYDKKMATQKLTEWDNDFIKVIKEYLNPKMSVFLPIILFEPLIVFSI